MIQNYNLQIFIKIIITTVLLAISEHSEPVRCRLHCFTIPIGPTKFEPCKNRLYF